MLALHPDGVTTVWWWKTVASALRRVERLQPRLDLGGSRGHPGHGAAPGTAWEWETVSVSKRTLGPSPRSTPLFIASRSFWANGNGAAAPIRFTRRFRQCRRCCHWSQLFCGGSWRRAAGFLNARVPNKSRQRYRSSFVSARHGVDLECPVIGLSNAMPGRLPVPHPWRLQRCAGRMWITHRCHTSAVAMRPLYRELLVSVGRSKRHLNTVSCSIAASKTSFIAGAWGRVRLK